MHKSEMIPDLVSQEPFVGKVDHIRSIHENHKSRWLRIALGGVKEFQETLSDPWRWMFLDHFCQGFIDFCRMDPVGIVRIDDVDFFQEAHNPFTGEGGDTDHGSKRNELQSAIHFPFQVCAFVLILFHEIPFVQSQHDAFSLVQGISADTGILL